MSSDNLETQPLSSSDIKLIDAFDDVVINQSNLMDSIGKQLIILELAISGIYATVLKFTSITYKIEASLWLLLIFILWFASLMFAFWATFPKKYIVDRDNLGELEKFFKDSATHKRRYLVISSMLFFAGIALSVFTII